MNQAQAADCAPRVIGAVAPALHAWLLAGQPYPAAASAALRRYGWSRRLFGFNLHLQRKVLAAPAVQRPPLFALGLWRAGTTYLHDLLATHPQLCTPRTWQCMAPSSFGVMGRPRNAAAVQRPMDGFSITADTPQEDEFALLMLGAPSVYRAWLDPRRLPELTALLAPQSWATPWPGESDWLDFLASVNKLEGPAQRLLLKSPNHSFRMRSLLQRFPDAPCVWITRDPADTWESNLKMWRTMVSTYGLAALPDGLLPPFLAQAFQHAANALEDLCRALPRERLVVLSLASLRLAPVNQVLATFERLGLAADDTLTTALAAAAQRHAHLPLKAYGAGIQPAPEMAPLQALAAAQAAALHSHGL